ncbi:MAG: HD domain-containing protein [Geobacter sp.]|nr:HD domain-containing protein [Geobacter sp.]
MEAVLSLLRTLFPPALHDRVFLVGGSVRDLLSGRVSQDLDLVAAVPPEGLERLGFRFVAAKSAAPIYFRFIEGVGKVEATLLDDVSLLTADLHRRDFTVNAMALSLGGELLGLTGESAELLRSGSRSLSLETVPVERFSAEMLKALAKQEPVRFFQRMLELGIGVEFLPELFRMVEVPAGPLEYHPEGDLCTHSLEVLERLTQQSDDPLARFCGLFHDLGKLATAPPLYPRHHGHEETGSELARSFCARLRLPALYRRALAATCRLHGSARRWPELRDSTRVRMAEQAIQAGIVEILPLVAAADKASGQVMPGWAEAVQVASMSSAELGVERSVLEGMAPEHRGTLLLQRRVERLRRMRDGSA